MDKNKFIKIVKSVVSVVVILAMFIIVYYQNRDRDIFKFGKSESNNVVSTAQNNNSGFSGANLRKSGNEVSLLSTTSYSVYDTDGTHKTVDIAFSQPVLHTEEKYAVCFENNSTQLYVFNGISEIYNLATENKILTAKVNKNGYLFLATEKDGYNCECTVYNRNGEPIFKWDISKSEFLDGDINYDNNTMVLSLASSGDNELVGEILLINITTANIINKQTYDASLFFSVDFNNNSTYVALGNNGLYYFNSDGTEKWVHEFKGKKLLKADVSSHDTITLAFSGTGEMFDGNSTEVIVLNKLGKKISEKTFDGNITDVCVGSNCVAIAIDKKIYITSKKLSDKKTLKTDYSIKQIALFDDDTHVFVLGSSGGKIIK